MSESKSFPLKLFNIDSSNANSHPREVEITKKKKKKAYHGSQKALTL